MGPYSSIEPEYECGEWPDAKEELDWYEFDNCETTFGQFRIPGELLNSHSANEVVKPTSKIQRPDAPWKIE
jgi:hypothetical protein